MTTTSLHLGYSEKPATSRVGNYPHRPPLGSVELDGGAIDICASDPVKFFELADLFAKAAHDLRAAVIAYDKGRMDADPSGALLPCAADA